MAGNAIAAKMAASKSGGISPALRAKTATFSQPNRPGWRSNREVSDA